MNRHNFFLVISLVAASTCFPVDVLAQVINGIVVDKTNKPIPFVSIGIVKGNYGIISKENGSFSLEAKKMKSDDTLKISGIGYHSKDYHVQEIQNISFLKVILEEYVYPIKEVTILLPGLPISFAKLIFLN